MPTFRPDILRIPEYIPGRPIADVAKEFGFDPASVVKLASNENPLPPIPEAREAVAALMSEANRYPDTECKDLRAAISSCSEIPPENIWAAAGSSEILRVTALATGGPGTSAVFPQPSFVIYKMGTVLALSEPIEVPLDSEYRNDLDALSTAIRPDTNLVYICNPNNPTGTIVDSDDLESFIKGVPERVLVLVDEAYHEFVTEPKHRSMVPLALSTPNVIVTRTFSKIFGLASLRVGYAVSSVENLVQIQKAQAPFTVTGPAQVAAMASLRHPEQVKERTRANASGRAVIMEGLSMAGVEFVPSQANFVYFHLNRPTKESSDGFLRAAVIVRPYSDGWLRVSVGSPSENERFLEALASVV